MRKALALLLTLVILLTGGMVWAARAIGAPKEDLTFRETTLYGDRAAADGLKLTLFQHYQRHLLWESRLDFDQTGFQASTDYHFSAAEEEYSHPHKAFGLQVVPAYDGGEPIVEEILSSLAPGERMEEDVRLADYYDYYPLNVSVDLDDLFYGYDPYELREGQPETPESYALREIVSFFKIPVIEDEYIHVTASRVASGNSAECSGWGESDKGDCFNFYVSGAVGEDACYVTFPNRTREGKTVDTSGIPGGYGIYRLPFRTVDEKNYHGMESYKGPDVIADELALFAPLDESVLVTHFSISGDKKDLILHTNENGRYVVTILDPATGETRQRLEICEDDPEQWSTVVEKENFIFIQTHDYHVYLLSKDADGLYRLKIDAAPTGTNVEERFGFWDSNEHFMTFDGERLAYAGVMTLPNGISFYDTDPSGDFYLAIYDSDSLAYAASFKSSLTDANPPLHNYAENVRPRDSDAVLVSWKG